MPAVEESPTVISPPVTVKSADVVKVPLVFTVTNSVLSKVAPVLAAYAKTNLSSLPLIPNAYDLS